MLPEVQIALCIECLILDGVHVWSALLYYDPACGLGLAGEG